MPGIIVILLFILAAPTLALKPEVTVYDSLNSGLPEGMYFLKLQAGGELVTRKVVKF